MEKPFRVRPSLVNGNVSLCACVSFVCVCMCGNGFDLMDYSYNFQIMSVGKLHRLWYRKVLLINLKPFLKLFIGCCLVISLAVLTTNWSSPLINNGPVSVKSPHAFISAFYSQYFLFLLVSIGFQILVFFSHVKHFFTYS